MGGASPVLWRDSLIHPMLGRQWDEHRPNPGARERRGPPAQEPAHTPGTWPDPATRLKRGHSAKLDHPGPNLPP
jgi:hypothetical protein